MKRNIEKSEPDPPPEQASAGEGSQGKTSGAPAKTNGRPPVEPVETTVPFFEQVAAIDPNDWDAGRYRLYVYRLLPRIENQGENHYIGRLQSAVDEADILAKFGSGRFHLKLNDTKARKTVAAYAFTAHDPEFPPRIEGAQILDLPENSAYRSWIQRSSARQASADTGQQPRTEGNAVSEIASLAKTILDKSEQTAKKQEQEPAVSDTVTKLLLGMAQGRDALAKELVQQKNAAPGLDPVQALAQAVALVKQLTPDAAAASPGPDFMLKRFEALENSNRDLLGRLLDKLSEKPPAPPTPPESEFQKTLMGRMMEKALDMLDGNTGRTGREKWWEMALHHPEVHKLGRSLGEAAINLSQAFVMSRGGRPGQPPVGRQTQTAADILQGLPPDAETQPPPGAAGPANSTPDPNPTMEQLAQFFTLDKFRAMMSHLNGGAPGQQFALWCADGGMSLADHAQIKAIGRDAIMNVIRATPLAWNVIRPLEAEFEKFLFEFLSWTPDWIPDEGPEA